MIKENENENEEYIFLCVFYCQTVHKQLLRQIKMEKFKSVT